MDCDPDLINSHRLSLSLALDALELDVLPRSLAVAAGGAHHKRTRGNRLHPSAVAILTAPRFRSWLASAPLTLGTRIDDVHVNVLVHATRRLRELQGHLDLLGTAEAKGGLGKVVELTAESLVAEDLPEQLLRVDRRLVLPGLREALGTSPGTTAACASHLLRRLAVHVVLTPLRLIGEHLVGLGHLLELLAGIRVVLVGVGVVLLRQLVVCLFNVLGAGLFVHSQDLVVVPVVQVAGPVEAAGVQKLESS